MGFTGFRDWLLAGSRIERIVRFLLILLFLLLVVATCSAVRPLAAFAGVVGASTIGAIGGLLFAIPKRTTVTSAAAAAGGAGGVGVGAGAGGAAPSAAPRLAIVANTSLEEVSDWLTKTIIGAGLVSWPAILNRLDKSGALIGAAIFDSGPAALPGGVAVLVAAASLGALAGYLWFSRYLPEEFADVDVGLQRRQAQGLAQERSPVAPTQPPIASDPPPSALPPPGPAPGGGGGGGPNQPGPNQPGPNQPGPNQPGDGQPGPNQPGDGQPGVRQAGAGQADGGDGSGAPGGADSEEGVRGGAAPSQEKALHDAARLKYALMRRRPLKPDDWAKGMFGGKPAVSNAFGSRRLSATVTKSAAGLYDVHLTILAEPVPATEAIFFLHNTFRNTTPAVAFDQFGTATLVVSAWGAFTVGALLDDGTTELELDLAELPDAPRAFRSR